MRTKTNLKASLVMAVFLLVTVCTAAGQTIFVDANAAGSNDGSSWADAYDYLQDALSDANSNPDVNEIRVAQGTYTPDSNSAEPSGSGDRYATFQLINAVTVKGGYAGIGADDPNTRDIEIYETILSGDLDSNDVGGLDDPSRNDNSYHVVTGSGTNATAVLDGFIITAGYANGRPGNRGGGMYNYRGSPTVINCTFSENSAELYGGGMYNDESSPTVINCTFTGNLQIIPRRIGGGGGMYNSYSNPTVTNCTFSSNRAATSGGGMYNDCGSPTVTNCTFSQNSATGWREEDGGGGMYNSWYSSPTLTNCTFSGNLAEWDGGGMCNSYDSSPTLTNCTVSGNSAERNGGGMYNWDNSDPNVTSCTFSGNSAKWYGGGMYNGHSSPTLTNCTFSGNSAERNGGGIFVCRLADPPNITNCILWGDIPTEIHVGGHIWPVITYSDVQGGWSRSGGNNIDTDPCFVDAGYWDPNGTPNDANDDFWVEGDYHLLPTSPCIDVGDPCGVYNGQVDIDGEPRVYGSRVDMGSDEACPDIEVSPLAYDFRDVELGTSSTLVVTISNVGYLELTLSDIAFQTGSSSDFSITSAPPLPVVIPPDGNAVDVEITYSPSAEGYTSAVLEIVSDDEDEGVIEVALIGVGVSEELPPDEQIAEILDFFDDSVADGNLAGDGPGKSAERRLNALRNMIEAAGDLIEDGDIEMACEQLASALKKTDGQPNPPDFVTGPAAEELAALIVALRATLECE